MPRPVVQETVKLPMAGWTGGNMILDGPRAGQEFAGIFIDQGRDDALDEAAANAGWVLGSMMHHAGRVCWHWLLPERPMVYVLIAGVPYSRYTLIAEKGAAAYGIGAYWPKPKTGRRGKSRLGVQVLFVDLLAHGYVDPMPFVVKASNSDNLVDALVAHNELLTYAERIAPEGENRTLEFWQVALPLVAGPVVTRGKELTSATRPIAHGHPRPEGWATLDYAGLMPNARPAYWRAMGLERVDWDYMQDLMPYELEDMTNVWNRNAQAIKEWANAYTYPNAQVAATRNALYAEVD